MSNKPIYRWNDEMGIATCTLIDNMNNKTYIGKAVCHPDDRDFMTDKAGLTIASSRATIKALQSYKNDELKPGLKALNQLYYSIKHSKHFNANSYEARALKRQIKMKEADIKVVNEKIKEERDFLKKYIDDKENFYQAIRKNRTKNN